MSQKQTKKVVQSFQKLLPKEFVIQYTKNWSVYNTKNNIEVIRKYQSLKQLSSSQAQVYDSIIDIVQQFKENDNQVSLDEITTLLISLKPLYQVGDKVQKIENLKKITFMNGDIVKEEKSEFEVQNGIVYLVIIWSYYDDCDDLLKSSLKMLEKNKKWGGKVKIVGISIDNDLELVKHAIIQYKLKQLDHFKVDKEFEEKNLKHFESNNLPQMLIINKWGRIDYVGQNKKFNIEERINKLISSVNEKEIKQDVQQSIEYNQEFQEKFIEEDRKRLKSQMTHLQEALNSAKLEGEFKITMQIQYIMQNGSKIVQTYKILLDYDIEMEEEPKLNLILDLFWNKIPQTHKHIIASTIRDTTRKVKEIKKKYQDVYGSLGVVLKYLDVQQTILQLNKCAQELKLYQDSDFLVNVNNVNEDLQLIGEKNMDEFFLFNQFYDDFNLSQTINKINNSIRKKALNVRVGRSFEKIIGYKKWKEDKTQIIEHKPGQVLLIMFWSSQNDKSINSIKQIVQIVEQNIFKWGDAVKFIFLNQLKNPLDTIDIGVNFLLEVNQESLNNFDFYFPNDISEDIDQKTKIKISYLPFYILIDKFGIIRRLGNLDISNVVNLVDELINEEVKKNNIGFSKAEKIINGDIPLVEITKDNQKKIIEFIQPENFMHLDLKDIFQFQIVFEQVEVNKIVKYKQPKIILSCKDRVFESLNKQLIKIFQIIPEIFWEKNITILKVYSVEYPGKICAVCQKNIIQVPQQYYSPFKQEHVCMECAEFDDKTKKGNQRFKYLDTLIFINGPLKDLSVLKDIEDHKIGKNLQLKENEEGSQLHSILCYGCHQRPEGPRYIAANVRPGKYTEEGYADFCQECFIILKNKKSEKAQKIFEMNQFQGMTEDNLFVRVLFNHGDYREF